MRLITKFLIRVTVALLVWLVCILQGGPKEFWFLFLVWICVDLNARLMMLREEVDEERRERQAVLAKVITTFASMNSQTMAVIMAKAKKEEETTP